MNKPANEIRVAIPPPNFRTAQFTIIGKVPYVQNKFSEKAKAEIHAKHEAGSTARKGKKRDPKDFQACYEGAQYRFPDGSNGIPASCFRNAAISACRTVGFKMTLAKLSFFVEPDGFDKDDGTPLIRFTKGKPHYHESYVRNETGVVDLRARPMWDPGWEAVVRIRFDGDQFTVDDIANLLSRVGFQVGIGEGRPDSKNSAGMGWGLFSITGKSATNGKEE